MPPAVYVVDDDADVRALLVALLSSVAIPTRTFASGVEFLREVDRSFHGCVLLDVRMPEINGLEVAEHLRRRGFDLPVILMSAFADVPMVIRGLKARAIDFVEKPFNSQDLVDRVQQVLAQVGPRSAAVLPGGTLAQRLDSLSRRERQVLEQIVAGKLNKEIAAELGIGLRTVETYRANVMKKMACKSLVELIHAVSPLAPSAPSPSSK